MPKFETIFRRNRVDPFLKSLPGCYFDAIQQVAKHGSPDYYLCIRGNFVGLEIKKSGHKVDEPSPRQKYSLEQIEKAGGLALVAYPENWEEIKSKLIDLTKGKK